MNSRRYHGGGRRRNNRCYQEIITSSLIQFKVSSGVEEKGCAKSQRGVQLLAA